MTPARDRLLAPLRRLMALVPVGVTEDSSEYNGPLSTYTEWHSAILGGGLMLAVLVAYLAFGAGAVLPFAAAWLRLALYAYTGKKLTLPGGIGQLGLLKRYMGQVRAEPHYYLGTSLAVATVDAVVLLVGRVPPLA